jgi:N-6 DNA Methylase
MSSKNKHNKLHGSQLDRSDERIKQTQEVFTPPELINKMIAEIPEKVLRNPNSKFIDNCAGDGNFLVELLKCLKKYHSEQHIVDNMLYSVELMEDNHKELCRRLNVPTDHPHYVCYNALEYHYRFDGTMGPITIDQFFI